LGLPGGFERLRTGPWRIALRADLREVLVRAGIGNPPALAAKGTKRFAGRGRPVRVELADGRYGVLRRFLHGGLLRRVTGPLFLGSPRPVRELAATEHARRAGVAVPSVLAAAWRPRLGLAHEGWLLTEEVPGAVDLVDALSGGTKAGPALAATGRETRRLHDAGVSHGDLHVKNVLLVEEGVVLIDFDKSRVREPLPDDLRTRNLLRFDRSVVKLSRRGVTVAARDRLRFFASYYRGELSRERRDALVSRCRRSLRWHRLAWSLFG
jgi:3-deoxy-D-manno-octulosonic acid kinase